MKQMYIIQFAHGQDNGYGQYDLPTYDQTAEFDGKTLVVFDEPENVRKLIQDLNQKAYDAHRQMPSYDRPTFPLQYRAIQLSNEPAYFTADNTLNILEQKFN